MDGSWQQSVESRLTSLDTRAGSMGTDIGTIRTDIAVLKTELPHLATKANLTELGTVITDKLSRKIQIYSAVVMLVIVVATTVAKLIK